MLTPEVEFWSTVYDNKPVRNTLYRTWIFWKEKTNWQKNNFICWVSFLDKTSVSSYTSASGSYSAIISSNQTVIIILDLNYTNGNWRTQIYRPESKIKTIMHMVVLKREAQCFPWGTEDAESQPFSPSMSQQTLCSRRVICKLFARGACYT